MKIMNMVDLAPRVCLILMLPSGVTLMAASPLGRDIFYGWPLALAWIGSLIWLGLMLVDFFKRPAQHADLVHKLDWIVRISVVIGLLAVSGYTFVVDEPFGVTTNPKWLAGKVAAYAISIFGGIMIRVSLRPSARPSPSSCPRAPLLRWSATSRARCAGRSPTSS